MQRIVVLIDNADCCVLMVKNITGLDEHLTKDSMIASYQSDPNFPFKMDTREMGGPDLVEKPKKKRQRKEKADKPPKIPSEKKKRGRKPKAEKLAAAAADAIHSALPPQPAGRLQEWTKGTTMTSYLPGEMMNGPQDMPLVGDVDMRRVSIENELEEVTFKSLKQDMQVLYI